MIELNLPAKGAFLLYEKQMEEQAKKSRRNEMRYWRSSASLVFGSQGQFTSWLEYTKWKKRPVKIVKTGPHQLKVFFLDHPHNKEMLNAE